jgi:hypothetical protein
MLSLIWRKDFNVSFEFIARWKQWGILKSEGGMRKGIEISIALAGVWFLAFFYHFLEHRIVVRARPRLHSPLAKFNEARYG